MEGKDYLCLTAPPIFTVTVSGKGKVKFTLEQTRKSKGRVPVYLYSFFNLALDGVGGQGHALVALLPGKTW
jgi:hypothetical protein